MLAELIRVCGTAIEQEDRKIRDGVGGRDRGGILQLNNERYYQFLVWRAATSCWIAEVEYGLERYDLALLAEGDHPLAVIEMKRWMSESGYSELQRIADDLRKLQKATTVCKIMMIFSVNHRPENVDFLTNKMRETVAELSEPILYQFDTANIMGKSETFWVSGWEVLG